MFTALTTIYAGRDDMSDIEDEYWWEIKAFYEKGAEREDLIELIQKVYEDGFVDGATKEVYLD